MELTREESWPVGGGFGTVSGRHIWSRVWVLLGYIYAAPVLGDGFEAGVRWVMVPVAVLSGLALWKWHRLRRLAGARKG